ncbi:hypothetical protein [Arthrobacter sp. Bi83]|uniref:hypothetical protein n=1 Tax=Arthrobacter sp. Bi83 TaxID=2822353 RepID=UPI001E3D01BD|nr:hypothetical protein [Arthrobacter sp. Bi83]
MVSDAGMLPAGNLRELDEANLRFMVGSRMTKVPNDLASRFAAAATHSPWAADRSHYTEN